MRTAESAAMCGRNEVDDCLDFSRDSARENILDAGMQDLDC